MILSPLSRQCKKARSSGGNDTLLLGGDFLWLKRGLNFNPIQRNSGV